jgi:hypothetical protein
LFPVESRSSFPLHDRELSRTAGPKSFPFALEHVTDRWISRS